MVEGDAGRGLVLAAAGIGFGGGAGTGRAIVKSCVFAVGETPGGGFAGGATLRPGGVALGWGASTTVGAWLI